MKTTKLCTIVALLLSIQLFSQDSQSNKFNLGINIGANLFDLKQNDFFDNYDGLISYSIGISAEYLINNKFSLLSGINYDRKSMIWEDFRNYDPNMGTFTVDDKMIFSYINIPIEVRYYIGKSNNLFVNTGGFYNHSLSIENRTKIQETGEDITLFKNEGVIKDYDYGISFGLGYCFRLNNKNHFSVELKNELGLANISDYQNTSLNNLKTNTIKLILNWKLPI